MSMQPSTAPCASTAASTDTDDMATRSFQALLVSAMKLDPPHTHHLTQTTTTTTTTTTTSASIIATSSGSHRAVNTIRVIAPSTSQPPPPEAAQAKPKKKRIRIKTERRREQCRANQARYRDKQRAVAMALDLTVDELRRQVATLEQQRRALYWTVNMRESATKVVIEYFRLVRYGINTAGRRAPPLIATAYGRRDAASYIMPTEQQQIAFLHASSHPRLRMDSFHGVEHFITQTRRFSTFYDDMFLQVGTIEPMIQQEETTTVNAAIEMELTITPATLSSVFPHVQHHDSLKWKMLGQRIRCRARGVYEFNAHSQLIAVDWTIDFVSALLAFLSIEEVAIVLQQAQIARDAYLIGEERSTRRLEAARSSSHVQDIEQRRVAHESKRRRPRAKEPKPRGLLARVYEEFKTEHAKAEENDEYLLHDGQGDDYVMV